MTIDKSHIIAGLRDIVFLPEGERLFRQTLDFDVDTELDSILGATRGWLHAAYSPKVMSPREAAMKIQTEVSTEVVRVRDIQVHTFQGKEIIYAESSHHIDFMVYTPANPKDIEPRRTEYLEATINWDATAHFHFFDTVKMVKFQTRIESIIMAAIVQHLYDFTALNLKTADLTKFGV